MNDDDEKQKKELDEKRRKELDEKRRKRKNKEHDIGLERIDYLFDTIPGSDSFIRKETKSGGRLPTKHGKIGHSDVWLRSDIDILMEYNAHPAGGIFRNIRSWEEVKTFMESVMKA